MATYSNGSGLKITASPQNLDKIMRDLKLLSNVEVLVGFPEDTTTRDSDPNDKSKRGITNAALAYIHDTGMPEQNIPARPFMAPALAEVQEKLTEKLEQVVKAVSQGRGPDVVERGMHQVGLIAKLAIQNKINEGIPPPLADSTLEARARRGRKGAKAELERRAKGLPPGTADAKPLIDTGQLRNAANYVIRARKKRGK